MCLPVTFKRNEEEAENEEEEESNFRIPRGDQFGLKCLCVSPCLCLMSEVCSRENQSVDSFGNLHLVKVDQEADRHIQEFHVAQELSLMNWQNFLNGFGFDKDAILNQNIEPQRF